MGYHECRDERRSSSTSAGPAHAALARRRPGGVRLHAHLVAQARWMTSGMADPVAWGRAARAALGL
jgi:hypothetical protein